jgi:hypothetical protein
MYVKFLVSLLASASFVSAALFNANELSATDMAVREAILTRADDPKLFREILKDEFPLKRGPESGRWLRHMIDLGRSESFAYLYNQIDSYRPELGIGGFNDRDKSDLLLHAFYNHNIPIFNFMLGQDFKYFYCNNFWPLKAPWTSTELKDLVAGHPEKANLFACSFLTPRRTVIKVGEMLDKIEISLHCVDNALFSPTALLKNLIISQYLGTDDEFAALFTRLIAAGAVVNGNMYADFVAKHPNHFKSERILLGQS